MPYLTRQLLFPIHLVAFYSKALKFYPIEPKSKEKGWEFSDTFLWETEKQKISIQLLQST